MKNFIVLACFLAFIFSVQAQEFQYCNFTIKSVPNTYTGPSGEAMTDVFARMEQINQTVSLVEETDLTRMSLANNVGSIEYEGTNCTCTLKVYSKTGFIGSYVYFNLKNRTEGVINFSQTWSKKIQSYRFYY